MRDSVRRARLTLLQSAAIGRSAYSAAGTERRLHLADGRALACLELGDPSGQPVLYFHGYPGSLVVRHMDKVLAGLLM